MSQSNRHQEALEMAGQANTHARASIQITQALCTEYIDTMLQQRQEGAEQESKHDSQTETEEEEEEQDEDYTTMTVRPQGKISKGAGAGVVRNQSGLLNRAEDAVMESIYNSREIITRLVSRQGSITQKSNENSFVSKNSLRSTSSSHSNKTKTHLKLLKNSGRNQSKGSKEKNGVCENEQSLERVHTFHLKRSPSKDESQLVDVKSPKNFLFSPNEGVVGGGRDKIRKSEDHFKSKKIKELIPSLKGSDRAFYIQENTKAQEDSVIRSIQPVINEIYRLLSVQDSEDTDGRLKSDQEIQKYQNLVSYFESDSEIENLRIGKRFKLQIRNVLGLPKSSISTLGKHLADDNLTKKASKRDDQWLYHLNIGNVMYLTPVTLDELLRLEPSQYLPSNTSPNITPCYRGQQTGIKDAYPPSQLLLGSNITSTPERNMLEDGTSKAKISEGVILDRIKYELSKDEILQQIVNIVVSLFCLGTELRFKYQHSSEDSKKAAEVDQIRSSSERWHANAIHLASIFLPDECPLVSHIINSYKKHHMKNRVPKVEQLNQDRIEERADVKAEVELCQEQSPKTMKKQKLIESLMRVGVPLVAHKSPINQSNSKKSFNAQRVFNSQTDQIVLKQAQKVQDLLKTEMTLASNRKQIIKSSSKFSSKAEQSPRLLHVSRNSDSHLHLSQTQSKPQKGQSGNGGQLLQSAKSSGALPQTIYQSYKQQSTNSVKNHLPPPSILQTTTPSKLTMFTSNRLNDANPIRMSGTSAGYLSTIKFKDSSNQHLRTSPNSQQRSPRESSSTTAANVLFPIEDGISIFDISRKTQGYSGLKYPQIAKVADQSRISDAEDDINLPLSLNNDRMIVRREFGTLKKPMDMSSTQAVPRGQIKILETSPRIVLGVSPYGQALNSPPLIARKQKQKLEDLLQRFETLQTQTQQAKAKLQEEEEKREKVQKRS